VGVVSLAREIDFRDEFFSADRNSVLTLGSLAVMERRSPGVALAEYVGW
jgi:hypothetical protein